VIIIIYLLDISLLNLFKQWCCKSRTIRKVTPIENSKFKTYIEDLPRIAHSGIPSYDIRLNPKYTAIIETMDSLKNGVVKSETNDEKIKLVSVDQSGPNEN
jgi:hypothetical protein